jgi:hypothetical protein
MVEVYAMPLDELSPGREWRFLIRIAVVNCERIPIPNRGKEGSRVLGACRDNQRLLVQDTGIAD